MLGELAGEVDVLEGVCRVWILLRFKERLVAMAMRRSAAKHAASTGLVRAARLIPLQPTYCPHAFSCVALRRLVYSQIKARSVCERGTVPASRPDGLTIGFCDRHVCAGRQTGAAKRAQQKEYALQRVVLPISGLASWMLVLSGAPAPCDMSPQSHP